MSIHSTITCDSELRPRQLHTEVASASKSFLNVLLNSPPEEGGWTVISPPVDTTVLAAGLPACAVNLNITIDSESCVTLRRAQCTTVSSASWVQLAIGIGWDNQGSNIDWTAAEKRLCGQTFTIQRVQLTPRWQRSVRATSDNAADLEVVCTMSYTTSESAASPLLKAALPRLYVVPPAVALPSDVQLSMDGQSAVVLSADGRASMQLTTSGGQNVTFTWDDESPMLPTAVSVHPVFDQAAIVETDDIVQDGERAMSDERPAAARRATTHPAHLSAITIPYSHELQLPRMSDLWNGSCGTGDLPPFTQRRALIKFRTSGRSPDVYGLEKLYRSTLGLSPRNESLYTAFGAEPAQLACPPFCPGTTTADWYDSASGLVRTSVQWSLQFVCECQGYTTGAKCLETAHAGKCPWGEGDDCKPCPTGAICPGGYRIWAQPGHWALSEAAESVLSCDPPNKERCLGWSAAEAAPICAEGYDSTTGACRGCRAGYFPNGPNYCEKCP